MWAWSQSHADYIKKVCQVGRKVYIKCILWQGMLDCEGVKKHGIWQIMGDDLPTILREACTVCPALDCFGKERNFSGPVDYITSLFSQLMSPWNLNGNSRILLYLPSQNPGYSFASVRTPSPVPVPNSRGFLWVTAGEVPGESYVDSLCWRFKAVFPPCDPPRGLRKEAALMWSWYDDVEMDMESFNYLQVMCPLNRQWSAS